MTQLMREGGAQRAGLLGADPLAPDPLPMREDSHRKKLARESSGTPLQEHTGPMTALPGLSIAHPAVVGSAPFLELTSSGWTPGRFRYNDSLEAYTCYLTKSRNAVLNVTKPISSSKQPSPEKQR